MFVRKTAAHSAYDRDAIDQRDVGQSPVQAAATTPPSVEHNPDGTYTVTTYDHLSNQYDETIAYYQADGRRYQMDFLQGATLHIRDSFFADGTRERAINLSSENRYDQLIYTYDQSGAVYSISREGYHNQPFTSEYTQYDDTGALVLRTTAGYTDTNYSARDVYFGPSTEPPSDAIGTGSPQSRTSGNFGFYPITSQRFRDYENAGSSLTIDYDDAGAVTDLKYYAIVGRSYTDLVRTFDTATGFVTTDTFLNYANTSGETLTTTYGPGHTLAEQVFAGLTGRAYTGVDRVYDDNGRIMSEARTGFAGTGYSAQTIYFKDTGKIDHTSFALDAGGNRIVGTPGDDILQGIGGDTLAGRSGADRFVIGASNETVQDFSRKQGDLLDLSSYLDNPNGGDFLGTAAFDGSHDAVRYEIQGANAFVSVDLDGDKSADLTFTVNNATSLKAADFLFA